MPRYLSKSRFKIGLDCPAKLFYTGKSQYPDSSEDDAFLEALAEGGYQVGALAKCYYQDGVEVSDRDYDRSLQQTNALLTNNNVTVFEGAFRYNNLFLRADIIEKHGNNVKPCSHAVVMILWARYCGLELSKSLFNN